MIRRAPRKDDLEAIHVTTLARLAEAAAELPVRVVQISAAGVCENASTAFFRTKARGDGILSSKLADYVILRPTLVLSHEAYGGSALLRATAALPWVQPRVFPDAKIQTVYVGDLAAAVTLAALGGVASGTVADITEPAHHGFSNLLAKTRAWQGWEPPVWRPVVPDFCLSAMGWFADLLGRLGWRSPLRTTALKTLGEGVQGDPRAWNRAGGAACRSLDETLSVLPSTQQDRLFARAYLALPMAIGVLALFWILSGVITLHDPVRAMSVLVERAAPSWMIAPTVIGGGVADILLGIGILWRPWAKRAALGMIVLSGVYLLGSVAMAPDLWADPLGPMVKVLPGMALASMVWLMLGER